MFASDRELRDQNLFTGRHQQSQTVKHILENRPGDPVLLVYYGPGGIGKSFLLRQIIVQAGNANIPAFTLYCDRLALPGAIKEQLRDSVQDFNGTDKDFCDFDREWRRLEIIEKKIKTLLQKQENNNTKNVGKIAGSAASTALETAAGIILPGPLGNLAGKILGQAGEVIAEASSEKLASLLIKRGLRRDEAEFYANVSDRLSASFARGINTLASRVGCVLLIVDTIEALEQYELWLKNLIIGRFDLSRIVFVFAGRRQLDSLVWRDWPGKLLQQELRPFTEAESWSYLLKRGIKERAKADRLYNITHGLPLALAIAAIICTSSTNASIDPSLGDVKAQVIDALLKYFLECVIDPKRREQFLASAVPRVINLDILTKIFPDPDEALDVYNWLRNLYTTQVRTDGLVFHDIVRSVFIEYLHHRSQDQLRNLNQKMAAYYLDKRHQLILFSAEWQQATLEYLYHSLYIDEDRSIQEAAFYFLNAQEFIGQGLIAGIINLLDGYPLEHPANQTWVDYCRAQLAFFHSQFEQARDMLGKLYGQSEIDLYLRANVVTSLAVLTQYQGKGDQSIRLHEEGLQTWRQLNDRAGLKRSLTNVGRIYRITRDWTRANSILEECKLLAEEDNDQLEVGRILLNMGYIALYQGQWVDAEKYYLEALRIASRGADHYDSSKARMRLGQLRVCENRSEDAISFLRESVEEYKLTGELFGEGFAHNYLGDALVKLKQWGEAAKELEDALALFQSPRVNARDRVGNVYHSFGNLHLEQRDYHAAERSYLQAIAIRRETKSLYYLPKSLIGLGLTALTFNRYETLDNALNEAEVYALRYNDCYEMAKLRVVQGHAHLHQGKPIDQVAILYEEAYKFALRFNGFVVRWVTSEIEQELGKIQQTDPAIAQQLLIAVLNKCRRINFDGKTFSDAETIANSRVPTLINAPQQTIGVLEKWLK